MLKMDTREKVLFLFDVDGTLTEPRLVIEPKMIETLKTLKKQYYVGTIGGSNLPKQEEQLKPLGNVKKFFDYVFAENGLIAFEGDKILGVDSIKNEYDREKLQEFINYVMVYIAGLKLPTKTGTFVEFRRGMINVSPVGRNCSQEERIEFNEYDKKHHIRETMVKKLQEKFPMFEYAIGGQISFDCFPKGWDKTYCLKYVEEKFDKIYFFGDKTHKGGNDFEIYNDSRTEAFKVSNPKDTMFILNNLITKLY